MRKKNTVVKFKSLQVENNLRYVKKEITPTNTVLVPDTIIDKIDDAPINTFTSEASGERIWPFEMRRYFFNTSDTVTI